MAYFQCQVTLSDMCNNMTATSATLVLIVYQSGQGHCHVYYSHVDALCTSNSLHDIRGF